MDWDLVKREGYSVLINKDNTITIKNSLGEIILNSVTLDAVKYWWEFG